MKTRNLLFILVIVFRNACFAQEKAVSPLKSQMVDLEATQVLVLGTPHLEQQEHFDLRSLDSLLFLLEKWAPDAICLEAHAPSTVALLKNLKGHFTEEEIQNLAEQLLLEGAPGGVWKSVLELLAAGENFSALIPWDSTLNLPEGGYAQVNDYLQQLAERRDERVSLAVALAKRLQHEKVFPIDDHTEKPELMEFQEQLMRELEQVANLQAVVRGEIYLDAEARFAAADSSRNLLPYYRFLNGSNYQEKDVATQWHFFYRTKLDSGLDRRRVALWEVRNLRIAAHIRRVAASFPGKRILVVIGAGHKPFLDNYLKSMMDVEVLNFADL